MDPKGKFSDARRPDFHDLSHHRGDLTATEMHEHVKSVYRSRLIEAGMPEPSAEIVSNLQMSEYYPHYEDLMRNLREIDASAARDVNAAAQRERLGVSREVQEEVEVRDTDCPATATEISIESQIPVLDRSRTPLGIREEVSDAGDLEAVSRAIEAQAKLLHRRSLNLKAEADKLFDVAAKLRFGGVS